MLAVLFFEKQMKIMLVVTVPKIMLVQSIKGYWKMAVHNSLNPLPYFPYMYYPGQGKNWG